MSPTTLNISLFIAVALSLWLNFSLPHDPATPNTDTVLPDMAHSIPADALAPSSVLPNGQTMQPPPPGTLAYGSEVFPYGPELEERTRAGDELTNPYTAADTAALARGKLVFERTCALCHGLGGNADGPIVQRGYPAPKSLVQGELLALRDGEIFHVITHGFKNMPAHAYQVNEDDRWKAILHIRQLQQEAAAATPAATAEPPTAPETTASTEPTAPPEASASTAPPASPEPVGDPALETTPPEEGTP